MGKLLVSPVAPSKMIVPRPKGLNLTLALSTAWPGAGWKVTTSVAPANRKSACVGVGQPRLLAQAQFPVTLCANTLPSKPGLEVSALSVKSSTAVEAGVGHGPACCAA